MAKHGVILVGAGDMGGQHARAWSKVGEEIAAIVDLDSERVHRLAEQYGVERTFSDYREAMAKLDNAEMVDICVPLMQHLPVTVEAARHGKHVLCEKPIARSLQEVDQMEEAIDRAGIKFAVGFQRNLPPGVAFLRDEVAKGRFGRPLLFTVDGMAEVRPKRFMHDKTNNNGPVVDLLGHYFLLWETVFASKPVHISADGFVAAAHRPEIAHFAAKAVDTAVVTVRYASGDVGSMSVSWGLAAKSQVPTGPERLAGPEAVAIMGAYRDFSWEGITIYRGEEQHYEKLPESPAFVLQAQAFLDYLEGRSAKPASGIAEGRHLLRLSLAALESIETGKTILL